MSSEELAVPLVPFVEEIREILLQARRKAYANTNILMVEAYWRVGQRIVEEEQQGSQRAEYGAHLLQNLARALGDDFGKGVSAANLRNFRQFYLTFPENGIRYAARSELSWSHWRLIMRVDGREAREFYIREVAERGLSTRDLARAINTSTFQRILNPPTASDLVLRADPKPQEFVKDPYVLEFLGLPDGQEPSERELEGALVRRLSGAASVMVQSTQRSSRPRESIARISQLCPTSFWLKLRRWITRTWHWKHYVSLLMMGFARAANPTWCKPNCSLIVLKKPSLGITQMRSLPRR